MISFRFPSFVAAVVALGLELTAAAAQAAYPPVAPFTPDPAQWEQLRRSLTLLAGSTPEHRHTVRVLFYGQSITEQAWWKRVAAYLSNTYPHANLVIENRAIGGHASQLLVKTAEADLYPFQPDLVIFHVYGAHNTYEDIIRRLRERTPADILLQTDHITKDEALTEETRPPLLTPKQWDAWMNHSFLPATAEKYGACRADVHGLWKQYLKDNRLSAAALLKDGVHLNAHGEWLMAELLQPYLAPLPAKPGYDPLNNAVVHTFPAKSDGAVVRQEFAGIRADVVLAPGATGPFTVKIDGKSPSEFPELRGLTRVSAFPQSNWPILLQVGSQAALVEEDWTLTLREVSADGKSCRFSLHGSKTGPDGEGVSTNRFVSNSGRIVLEPADWNLGYCYAVFKRPLPDGHEVRWRSSLRGTDVITTAPTVPAGVEAVVTVAQGLPPGNHTLELRAPDATTAQSVRAVRSYQPPLTAAKK